jgi:hypothetical protein
MNPTIAQAVAEARIADLHRTAAARRRSRSAAPRPVIGMTVWNKWSSVRRAATAWITAHAPVRAASDPACCAA